MLFISVESSSNQTQGFVIIANMSKLTLRDIMRIIYRMLSLPIIAILVIIPFLIILFI